MSVITTSFLNIRQASKVLGVSTRTIQRYLESEQLRSIRPIRSKGCPHLFHIKDLYAYFYFGVNKYAKLTTPQKAELQHYLSE